jgi:PrtD family type I secretion system ABC transporter
VKTDNELKNALQASRGAFMAVGVFSFVINILMLTGPLFMLQIYDRVLTSRSVPTLIAMFVLVAGLFTILGLLELVRSRVLVRIGTRIDERLSGRVFESVMRQSLNPSRDAASAAALKELDTLRQFLTGPGPFALFDAPWVPVYIVVIFLFHWTLGVLAIAGAVILFIVAVLNDYLSRKPLGEASTALVKASYISESGRRNAEVLGAIGMMNNFRALWQVDHNTALSRQAQASDRAGALTAFSKSLRLFLQSAMLASGAALAIFQVVTPGVMIASSIILGRALQPVEQAIGQWRGLIRAIQAYRTLKGLLRMTPPYPEKTALPPPKGRLVVDHVRAVAPVSNKLILNNVGFRLDPGQVLGVIGPSASGKSTLARILVGVWPVAGGEVRLDGATFDQWNPVERGKFTGYLPQDVELFNGTISQNICRFEPDAASEKIVEAAQRVGVHEMILQLPDGYDTVLSNMGGNISAGQRQRIALARAIYGDPVVVVLDEPNSNLDTSGDDALISAIRGMRKRGQTVIVIAHRRGILAAVDFLLVLDGGIQRAFGPRDKVLAELTQKSRDIIGKRKLKEGANDQS